MVQKLSNVRAVGLSCILFLEEWLIAAYWECASLQLETTSGQNSQIDDLNHTLPYKFKFYGERSGRTYYKFQKRS
jgi:hypothetical protein